MSQSMIKILLILYQDFNKGLKTCKRKIHRDHCARSSVHMFILISIFTRMRILILVVYLHCKYIDE